MVETALPTHSGRGHGRLHRASARHRSARPRSSGPSGRPGTHRVGLGRSVQLDHVALQVLLLHELLRAGGALEDRPRSPEAPRLPGREPKGRAQPEMIPTGREGHTGEGLWCYAHAEAEAALRGKTRQPCPKMREHRTRDTGHGDTGSEGRAPRRLVRGRPPDTIPGKGLGGRAPGAAPRPPAMGTS